MFSESRFDLCDLLGITPTVTNKNWAELAKRKFKRTARDLRFVLQTPKYSDLITCDELAEFVANPKMHTFGRQPEIFSQIGFKDLTV